MVKIMYELMNNKNREFSMDDAITLTESIPVFGSVVASIKAGKSLGSKLTRRGLDKEACYRRNWSFQVTGRGKRACNKGKNGRE